MIPFAILFGLDYIATVALVADNYGRQNVGTVYGWVFAAHQLGAASAAWAGGTLRDALGAYNLGGRWRLRAGCWPCASGESSNQR